MTIMLTACNLQLALCNTTLHGIVYKMHFLSKDFALHICGGNFDGTSQWSAYFSTVLSFISLEPHPSSITPSMWSVEITKFRQILSAQWQYRSNCGAMCCQLVSVASCRSRIGCPGFITDDS